MKARMKKDDSDRVVHEDYISHLTFIKGLKDVPEKLVYVKEKEKKKKKFKNWCMPTQIHGYIKCRKHDFF
jgi:hypothetical protein